MLISVRPLRCQPSLMPYLTYLDIYFLHLCLKSSEAMLVLMTQAGCLSSEERGVRKQSTETDAETLGFLAHHLMNPQGLVK